MNILNICPCCSNSLIHHFGNHREYWFCRHCWSEMPNPITFDEIKHQQLSEIANLYPSFYQLNKSAYNY